MTTCYIIDDDPTAIEVLNAYIAQIPELHLLGNYTDPFLALNGIRQGEKPGLIFISIELRQLSGIELAQLIDPSIKMIFTTANPSYKRYRLPKAAVNLLPKPFSFELFLKCIQEVFNKLLPQLGDIPKVATFFSSKWPLITL